MWGGRKLETELGKKLPQGASVGESWEIYDFPPGTVDGTSGWLSSIVAYGDEKGTSLHELMVHRAPELTAGMTKSGEQFPLLIKFLDAREDLSVQVHPDEQYARSHPAVNLKHEAWFILERDPGSRILKDLSPGVDRDRLLRAIEANEISRAVQSVPVRQGECYYLPSGTVHALGAGILVAEIQTPSDTTFRLFDFNRVDPASGKPRKLHLEEALECVDYHAPPRPPERGERLDEPGTDGLRLLSTPAFTLDRITFNVGVHAIAPVQRPVVLIVVAGVLEIDVSATDRVTLRRGGTVLIPARCATSLVRVLEPAEVLRATP